MKTRIKLDTYLGEGKFHDRLAILYELDARTYCVDIYNNDEVIKTVSYDKKSLAYHESVAENFVMGIKNYD